MHVVRQVKPFATRIGGRFPDAKSSTIVGRCSPTANRACERTRKSKSECHLEHLCRRHCQSLRWRLLYIRWPSEFSRRGVCWTLNSEVPQNMTAAANHDYRNVRPWSDSCHILGRGSRSSADRCSHVGVSWPIGRGRSPLRVASGWKMVLVRCDRRGSPGPLLAVQIPLRYANGETLSLFGSRARTARRRPVSVSTDEPSFPADLRR